MIAAPSFRRDSESVPRKSQNGYDTIYSSTERLLAIPIGCGLVGLGWLDQLVLGYTLVGAIVGFVLGFGVLTCLWITVVGRMSDD